MERRSGLQSLSRVNFSTSPNHSGLHFTYFINSFRPKVLLFHKQNVLGRLHNPQSHISPGKWTTAKDGGPRPQAGVLLLYLCALLWTFTHNFPASMAQRAAPTCSNGCLLVHCHGYSCAHRYHHRLTWTSWGKENCQVTFSAAGEEQWLG